jgi:hypothetical protein
MDKQNRKQNAEQVRLERIVKKEYIQKRTASTGQPDRDRQNKTAMIGLPGQDFKD